MTCGGDEVYLRWDTRIDVAIEVSANKPESRQQRRTAPRDFRLILT